jgi:hypothetical protein
LNYGIGQASVEVGDVGGSGDGGTVDGGILDDFCAPSGLLSRYLTLRLDCQNR